MSTLTGQRKGSHPPPPAAMPFPSTWSDDFEAYTVGEEGDYFADQTGVWEVSLIQRESGEGRSGREGGWGGRGCEI